MILTIRTDKPDSEIGLYDDEQQVAYHTWHAHRQLAETIHQKIQELLGKQHKRLEDITGIIVYKGPGSFTGLRIGLSVANALAYSFDLPITSTNGDEWIRVGIESLRSDPSKRPVVPEYGGTINVTTPRK